MLKDKIARIRGEIEPWDNLLASQNQMIQTTKEILEEVKAGFASDKQNASRTQKPLTSEEIEIYNQEIERCNKELAAMAEAAMEAQRRRNNLERYVGALEDMRT